MNLGIAHVLDGMGRQRFDPGPAGGRAGMDAGVEQDVTFSIAADKVARGNRVIDRSPTMGVYGDDIARWNAGIEHADTVVLEHQPVVRGSGGQSVKRIRPWPG